MAHSWPITTAGVVAAAVTGGLATDPDSSWFCALRKPWFYPPPQTFGLVWTPLYAIIAWAGAEGIDRARAAGDDRAARRISAAFGVNMALNAGWNVVFFRAHRPWAALVEICVLAASVLDLAHQVNAQSPRAGRAMLAYAAWTGFAGLLTAAIAWKNRRPAGSPSDHAGSAI